MRAVVQRVSSASVTVSGAVVGAIGRGLLVLVCAMDGDAEADVAWMAAKLPVLRIFPAAAGAGAEGTEGTEGVSGRMDLALADLPPPERSLLLVSQFTLSADLGPGVSKGNRPAFLRAMAPAPAEAMVADLAARLGRAGLTVARGRFGAHMDVALQNDGPVTLWLDTRQGRSPTTGVLHG